MNTKWVQRAVLLGLVISMTATLATAELQTVQVGGELRIRGYLWRNAFNPTSGPMLTPPALRWPGAFLLGRPIGDYMGGQSVLSYYNWDSRYSDYKFIMQRTRLNVNATFTGGVQAFTELDALYAWGDDFRSNYITGADRGTANNDDVQLYQAYVQAEDIWGYPVRLRIGRQELVLGNSWLMGNNSNRPEFGGLSFDAVRETWTTDLFSLDAFYAKLADRGVIEQDGDVDLYGLYGSYTGLEDITLDAYWIFIRDARSINDTNFPWLLEWVEDIFGLDDYDPTRLHTIGLRAAGVYSGFDFDVEGAYQFGDAGQVGSLFRPSLYGDHRTKYRNWAGTAELGYTFDVAWTPRVYLGGAYFEGEDNRGISFWDWVNPFYRPKASVSFNRLFSDRIYSVFLDEMGQMSNFWTVRSGVAAQPTEAIEVGVDVAYLEALKTFDQPVTWRFGRFRIPVAPALSFWTTSTSVKLGIESGLWVRYRYSDDLIFSAGWSHLFTQSGLTDGNYTDFNGLQFTGGTGNKDADYLYVETQLSF